MGDERAPRDVHVVAHAIHRHGRPGLRSGGDGRDLCQLEAVLGKHPLSHGGIQVHPLKAQVAEEQSVSRATQNVQLRLSINQSINLLFYVCSHQGDIGQQTNIQQNKQKCRFYSPANTEVDFRVQLPLK